MDEIRGVESKTRPLRKRRITLAPEGFFWGRGLGGGSEVHQARACKRGSPRSKFLKKINEKVTNFSRKFALFPTFFQIFREN